MSTEEFLAMCAGEETYAALQHVLEEMLETGSLQSHVDVPVCAGSEETERLDVVWHLCSDHKLVSLVSGMGGSGLNSCCFLCYWDRSDPFAPVSERTAQEIQRSQAWAEEYLRPLNDSICEVCTIIYQILVLAMRIDECTVSAWSSNGEK
jgi:hypothetical protein